MPASWRRCHPARKALETPLKSAACFEGCAISSRRVQHPTSHGRGKCLSALRHAYVIRTRTTWPAVLFRGKLEWPLDHVHAVVCFALAFTLSFLRTLPMLTKCHCRCILSQGKFQTSAKSIRNKLGLLVRGSGTGNGNVQNGYTKKCTEPLFFAPEKNVMPLERTNYGMASIRRSPPPEYCSRKFRPINDIW